MNHVQNASDQIANALKFLEKAKQHLLLARSEQHIPLVVAIAKLEEVYEILEDPECTPEILEEMHDD